MNCGSVFTRTDLSISCFLVIPSEQQQRLQKVLCSLLNCFVVNFCLPEVNNYYTKDQFPMKQRCQDASVLYVLKSTRLMCCGILKIKQCISERAFVDSKPLSQALEAKHKLTYWVQGRRVEDEYKNGFFSPDKNSPFVKYLSIAFIQF